MQFLNDLMENLGKYLNFFYCSYKRCNKDKVLLFKMFKYCFQTDTYSKNVFRQSKTIITS